MLDKPTDLQILSGFYNLEVDAGRVKETLPMREILIRLFGATVREDRLLESAWYDEYCRRTDIELIRNPKSTDWTPDMLKEFLLDIDNHYRELAEKRESKNTDNRNKGSTELISGEN